MKVFVLRAAGVPAVHAGAAHPYGDWKGEEPLAKCGRTLGCTPAGTTWNIFICVTGSALIFVGWIRICIWNADPDPGGQNGPLVKKKIEEINCFEVWMFSFERWRLL